MTLEKRVDQHRHEHHKNEEACLFFQNLCLSKSITQNTIIMGSFFIVQKKVDEDKMVILTGTREWILSTLPSSYASCLRICPRWPGGTRA